MATRKICVVTGSRADYGLLSGIMQLIRSSEDFELQVVVTGMHLVAEFGHTYRVIEVDGFTIDAKVETLLAGDTPVGIAKSVGLGVIGCAEVLERLAPDLLLLLGDRFEIFAAAQAALFAGIPVAHIAGGDTTEGAFDEALRHSITKMSHLHFVTNDASFRRVCQLGEDPGSVHLAGSPGIDCIRSLELLGREDLAAALGVGFKEKNLLVAYHPETLGALDSAHGFQALLDALDELGDGVGIIFTMPNADPGGIRISLMIKEYVAGHGNSAAYASLGQLRFYSLIAQVDAVIGNSSSGLYEVPSFGKPSVNIGDRQKGRLRASSVIDCPAQKARIGDAIREALARDCRGTVNPYGDGNSSSRIMTVLRETGDFRGLLKKRFFDQSPAAAPPDFGRPFPQGGR